MGAFKTPLNGALLQTHPWSRAKHLREVTRHINRRGHITTPLKEKHKGAFQSQLQKDLQVPELRPEHRVNYNRWLNCTERSH